MNDVKQVSLAVQDLRHEFAILNQYYEIIRGSLHFPQVSDFITEYKEFVKEGYLDLIVNLKVVQLFKKLEDYLREILKFKKQLFELSELPQSALPAFEVTLDPHRRRMSSKCPIPEPDSQCPIPSLTQMFLDQVIGRTIDEVARLFLLAKISKKNNQVSRLKSEVQAVQKRVGNDRFVDYLKKFDDRPHFDFLSNAKPVLVRRHRSVPVKFTLEKLGRICDKQQRQVESLMKAPDSRRSTRLFEYSLLLDLTGQLVDRQREERLPELLQKELKMILTKRKISMFYEDNPAIVESLRKEIRAVKKANYQKWLRLKAHLEK
jgi:hypothetical protein